MIDREGYYDELLNEIHIKVLDETGFNLKFTRKEMNESLGKLLLLNLDDDDNMGDKNSFLNVSTEFEKTHCKIINNGIYIKQCLIDGDIKFYSKHALRDAYEHMTCTSLVPGGQPDIFIDRWTTANDNIRRYDNMGCYPHPIQVPARTFNIWTPFRV